MDISLISRPNEDDPLAGCTASVRNFKSFGADGFVLNSLRTLNLVVGRNNVGKSSVLDAIAILTGRMQRSPTFSHKGVDSDFQIELSIPAYLAESHFAPNTSGGYLRGSHWAEAGQYLSDCRVTVRVLPDGRRELVEFHPNQLIKGRLLRDSYGREVSLVDHPEFKGSLERLSSQIDNPYTNYQYFRISAERDIRPEPRVPQISLDGNGSGFTNIVCQIITSAKHNSSLIEKEFLQHVNSILFPDLSISSLGVQELENGHWEIFLDETDKGKIALSQSGSGIKTVFLCVAATFVMPRLGLIEFNRPTIFMIEEPENNLHPALQRRLSDYMMRIVSGTEHKIVATSHSSALMDSFSSFNDCQIIHVATLGESVVTSSVNSYSGKRNVLDDIDARASDILLSNGVVWVEGPSDRIYISKMVELTSEGKLVEGVHYQCIFYGGRLLNHLTADIESEGNSDGLNIFRVARNAAVVIDSDRSRDSDPINATKTRIGQEIEESGGTCWITEGREFENYLPAAALTRIDHRLSAPIGTYEQIEDYLAAHLGEDEARRLIRSKSQFAEEVCEGLTAEDIVSQPNLHAAINALIEAISSWNGLAQAA